MVVLFTEGYIVDTACVNNIKAFDTEISVLAEPEKHPPRVRVRLGLDKKSSKDDLNRTQGSHSHLRCRPHQRRTT